MKSDYPSGLFARLEVDPIANALIRVYADYSRDGLDPGSDKWSTSDRYRRKLHASLAEAWSDTTGIQDWKFPLSEEAVGQLWVEWRKATNGTKAAWRLYVDAKHGNEVIST